MKSIILCLVLLIMANLVYSQPAKTTAPMTKQAYLQKSKNQKTAAWLFMGWGIVVTGLGLRDVNHADGNSDGDRQVAALITGITAIGIGTAFFIASSNNKKKGEALTFRMERVPVIQQRGFVYNSYPALAFRLNF